MIDIRFSESIKIKDAYKKAEKELAQVGTLLRSTEAGKYNWANEHKTIISGLTRILAKLRDDVPKYDGRESL